MEENNKTTQELIHEKGFSFTEHPTTNMPVDYNKIKIGLKTLEDATIDLNIYRRVLPPEYCTKEGILRALARKDYPALRAISDHFYNMSGIYRRVCNYFAELYRYDWYVEPENLNGDFDEEKLVAAFTKTLNFLDNSYLKKMCADIALKVVKYGCYYGYIIESKDRLILQELPPEYCRCIFQSEGLPVIEFNMAYFDDKFPDEKVRAKILVQKLPRDKNGDLIFDVDEARDIHNNAVAMLRRAIGVDVITTFADVDLLDVSANATADADDDLENAERTVYNDLGVSRNLFNTDGNLSLEKSILDDESTMRDLILQFNRFFSHVIRNHGSSRRKYNFRFYMLETTQYNYKEMSKLYKEQTQVGFSKMLPQIALGHSQSMILNTIFFENTVLHLSAIMVPPLMSSTLSSNDILDITGQRLGSKVQAVSGEQKEAGRPEKPEDEKSDKTIANQESMN